MIVHVATANPVKVRATRAAFGRGARVVAVDVKGDVPEQPVSMGQILRGARTRAGRAFPGADYGVGIEAGLFRLQGRWYAVTVAAVTDGKRTAFGGSPFFEMPDRLAKAVVEGDEQLGRRFAGRGGGAIAAMTKGRVTRERATRDAVLMALAPWKSLP